MEVNSNQIDDIIHKADSLCRIISEFCMMLSEKYYIDEPLCKNEYQCKANYECNEIRVSIKNYLSHLPLHSSMKNNDYFSICSIAHCYCLHKSKIYLDSNGIDTEYKDYIFLINLRNKIFSYGCVNCMLNEKKEEFKKLFIEYETYIANYKLKYDLSKSKVIINNISNILFLLRDKNEVDIKKDIDMLISTLHISNNINDIIEGLKCYPGNELYNCAKESFNSKIYNIYNGF